MSTTAPTLLSKRRTRLLTAVRDAAVCVASSADDHGDYIAVDAWRFKLLVRTLKRLLKFEDQHTT